MAITVSRPKLNWRERLYLPAIVAGLAITFKHFKNLLLGRTKVTMQYPEQKWDGNLPDYYRGAPALVRDEDGRVRCVACQLCEFICPPRAIKIIPGEIPPADRFAKVEQPPAKQDRKPSGEPVLQQRSAQVWRRAPACASRRHRQRDRCRAQEQKTVYRDTRQTRNTFVTKQL